MESKQTESDQPATELIDAQIVARMLRLKVSTVYAAAKAGKLPHVVLWRGRRRPLLRFRRDDIESLMKGRATSSSAER